eukprot:TRINITY_DN17600_c0_g1_i1.p1 TRINITY_DN17600_c0_g1~~TRINITY_DN17600_c0_g1_i1.p1  ORF type:complete len:87 (+),score=2.52 TRINITY_DN17600_c0_g1_i1:351-611(+)
MLYVAFQLVMDSFLGGYANLYFISQHKLMGGGGWVVECVVLFSPNFCYDYTPCGIGGLLERKNFHTTILSSVHFQVIRALCICMRE